MGKKTKKTRWRTLSIGDAHSDGETTAAGEYGTRKQQHPWRAARAVTTPWHHSSSTHSTPDRLRQNGSYRGHRHFQQGTTTAAANQQHGEAASKSTTRSSSSVSERKITFNEDEYTRITTPRQDVLFKKGYLSRPKPHMQHSQRPLTSAGNSTGDGTPDHQSADGTEYNDGEHSPFLFPGAPPFMDANGAFFVNGFEPFAVPPAHVLVYDQYGNAAAVCFPPPPPPHLPQPPAPSDLQERRLKRYSTDSMPESSSPHPGDKQPRHRRRPKPAAASDADESSISSTSSLSGDESDADEATEAPPVARDSSTSSPKPIKYSVDAEEFVPRAFRTPQPIEFVPLPMAMSLPPELYPGAFLPMFVPPPSFFHQPSPHSHQEQVESFDDHMHQEDDDNDDHDDKEEEEEEAKMQDEEKSEAVLNSTAAAPIDIAKIVSKLEQAALEQKRIEVELLEKEEEEEEKKKKKAPVSPIEEKTEPKSPITTRTTPVLMNTSRQLLETTFEPSATTKITTISNINNNNNNNQPTATAIVHNGNNQVRQQPRYSERLKLPATKTTQHHRGPSTPPTPPIATTLAQKPPRNTNYSHTCPRLDKHSRQQSIKATVTIPTPLVQQKQQTHPVAPDQWISVSGKKKRGKNKSSSQISGSTDGDISEAAASDGFDTAEVEVQILEEKEEKEEAASIHTQLVSKPEDTEPSPIEAVVVLKRERNNNNNSNKASKKTPTRKRIIITDGPIAPLFNTVAQNNTQQEQIEVKMTATADKSEKESANEVNTVTVKSASKKKKKNKSKSCDTTNNVVQSLPETTNGMEHGVAGGVAEKNVEKEAEDLEAENDEKSVEEELARMIERGLCGPLEERLRSFNPSDSFLMDGLRPPRRMPAALKPFESIALKRPLQPFGALTPPIVTPRLVVTAATAPVCSNSVPNGPEQQLGAPAPETVDSLGQRRSRFPITLAVREWMDRTRETTPEVEIFKKPDEIRQEFLVLSDDEESATPGEEVEEMMTGVEKGEDLINHPRCGRQGEREPSADLLDCWEPDVCLKEDEEEEEEKKKDEYYPMQTPPPTPELPTPVVVVAAAAAVEEAEDALAAYESVYGCSGDLERIQHEIQMAQRQRHPRGDGGLPYRAICCSVM